MSPSAAVTAAPAAAPVLLSNVYKLSPLEAFGPYGMYSQNRLSHRAMHAHFGLKDMQQRRLLGGHTFGYIDLDEIGGHLGSDNTKRNAAAVNELKRVGLWYQTDGGIWYPATDVDQLHIETEHRRELRNWLASLTGRSCIISPRLLFKDLSHLNLSQGQVALRLELLTRCKWTGNKAETTASTDLHLSRLAARWGMTDRTFHSALKQPGNHLQLIREHTPGRRIRRYGHRYRVVVSRAQAETVQQISGVSTVQRISGVSAKKVQQISGSLDLSLSPPSYEGVTTPSSPADPAEDPGKDIGACQPLGKGQDLEDKTVTTVQDLGTLPANTLDPELESEAETPTQALDVLPADPVDRLPADSDPEEQDVTAQDLGASPIDTAGLPPLDPAPKREPIPTADPLPTNRHPEPEPTAETPAVDDPTLPLPDRHNLIEADLRDPARLYVIYLQYVACGYLTRCAADRRHVVTAAVHALRVGKKPCALFHRIVTEQWWSHPEKWDLLSQADEDKAGALIKAQEPAFVNRELRLVRKSDAPPDLSEDAKMVAHFLVHELAEKGYRGDPFHAFKKNDRGRDWTRPRWEAALAELETPLEPACLSPAVTPPDLPVCGSDLAQTAPSIVPMGLPLPAAETSLQKPTEAPTPQKKKTEMLTSRKEQIPQPAEPLPGNEPVSLRYLSDARVLRDDGDLLKLYAEAVLNGQVPDDDEGLLQFIAAAEHALHAGGVPDRPLLFRTILRGKWGLVTHAAEDRARQRLSAMNFRQPSHGDSYNVSP